MPNPDLYEYNLMKSVEHHLKNHADTAAYAASIFTEDSQFDPSGLDAWAQIQWVDFAGRVFTQNTFHLRCFHRPEKDRFGRTRELRIGAFRSAFVGDNGRIPFLDVTTDPDNIGRVQIGGEDAYVHVRFRNRGPVLDAEGMLNPSQVKGVSVVVLTYDVHAARISEVN